jgi:hypothetical protein
MTIVPRNKRVRTILGGCAALSAVMIGPILVDASAQATPQTSCLPGGACLTSATTTVTTPVTTTTTTTAPGTTTTTTAPGTTTTTTAPGTTTTILSTATDTTTRTVTATVTSTETDTTTVTLTTTDLSVITEPTTTTTTTTTTAAAPMVRANNGRKQATTTTTSTTQCEPPGQTSSIGNGEVETCGPARGELAVFPTTPGVYTKIFANDGPYYVSVGIFAPQIRFGHVVGCYYVPTKGSVTDPGQTSSPANGVLADAVAFGKHLSDVSRAVPVLRYLCGTR